MSQSKATNDDRPGSFQLGEHRVARIGFGAMQLERLASRPEEAVALLRRAIDLGADHVDTAQFYANGFVNEVIRTVWRERPALVVVTKIGGDPNPGKPFPIKLAQRPEELRASVEANLRSLGTEQLPVVNLRRPDVPPGLTAEGDQVVDIDDQLATMIVMRDEGKIGAIGVGSVSRANLERALPAGIVCVQSAYSLLSRHYEDMLNLCAENGIAWVPFFPLGGASSPGWMQVTAHPRVVEIAANLGVTPSQLGLAWLLAHRPNILLIPGTASRAHLEENIASSTLSIDAAIQAELDALGVDSPATAEGKNS